MSKKYYVKFKGTKIKLSGFTLIEILIASYIFVVVILAGAAIFSSSIGAKMKATSFWETQQDGRYLMEKISKAIRDPAVKGFKISLDQKTLELCSDIDSSGQCLKNLYTFTLSRENIYFKGEDNSLSALNTDNTKIKDLKFSGYYPSGGARIQPYITIEMTIENKAGKRKIDTDSLTLKTTVSLRNYGYKYQY